MNVKLEPVSSFKNESQIENMSDNQGIKAILLQLLRFYETSGRKSNPSPIQYSTLTTSSRENFHIVN